ncbi:2Fe-2S iron-sulfur cluster-binding protein [Nonomuraea soli]|uniref:Ring-1,2-phenylacetyl-CoA epoxidase subunit PaaE n=1 Tax=Nonomuraea soli TaxID=1032476 RepID=A0A7W0HSW3_9ACTN|nr:2Fe-2S iron-sulfur cluster-binding protein [Nonomuraea soli]MBA2894415.1 ring-1,2-phenylacetyl-CoA epoxidase subunit PaaE [Nonomuraea soli]
MARFRPLTVAAVDRLTDDAVAITFAERVPFVQGQHLNIRVFLDGLEIRRSYSICSPAGGPLRIAVKRLDGGAFSTYANAALRPGDVLEAMEPAGRFHVPLDPAARRHHVAVAAGSGITPVVSLAATTLAAEPSSRFSLVFANCTAREVMFAEELGDLKDRYGPRFALVHVLSREETEAPVCSGRLDEARLRTILGMLGEGDEHYVCGPIGLVETVKRVMGERPVHHELFYAGQPVERPHVTPEGARLEFRLDGRTSAVVLHEGETLLSAALRVRSDAPYACRGGVCGTCRVRVLSGQVEMARNYALEGREVAAGYVLSCQSQPTSPEVRVEFD